jgi:uncharacterized protein YndB with AHSA1/START domain
MTAEPLTGSVQASIHIEATPERVFAYFTQPEALTSWMGEYATLDPTSGASSASTSAASRSAATTSNSIHTTAC